MEQADGNSTAKSPAATQISEESKVSSMRRITSALSIRNSNAVVMKCAQLGVARALKEPFENRDILYQDFYKEVNSGSEQNKTPKHPYGYFKFIDYSPLAFRYFRDAYSINTEDYLKSLCGEELKELSASGRSGSIFFKSYDDLYVLKSLESREAKFLRKLLAGYFISLRQKFRMCVMNNLLPSTLKLTEIYDLKGSTHNRRANAQELKKSCPTFKDLDIMERRPKGFLLAKEYHDLVFQTLNRDTRVLQGFEIMDYSLLIGVHNITKHSDKCPCGNLGNAIKYGQDENVQNLSYELRGLVIDEDLKKPINYQGGIPATDESGMKYLIFIGIIDILQTYRFAKKLEHNLKAMVGDGKTISVSNPTFYKQRFLRFLEEHVFLPLDQGQINIPPQNIQPPITSSPSNLKIPKISGNDDDDTPSPILTEDDSETKSTYTITENGNKHDTENCENNSHGSKEEFSEDTETKLTYTITENGNKHDTENCENNVHGSKDEFLEVTQSESPQESSLDQD